MKLSVYINISYSEAVAFSGFLKLINELLDLVWGSCFIGFACKCLYGDLWFQSPFESFIC